MRKTESAATNADRKFSEREVSKDTFNILSLLKVSPRPLEIPETVENFKKAFSWLLDRGKKERIELLTVSGEADPRFWNAVEKELIHAVSEGMTSVHCLGPVVCTDEYGKNAILETYKKYPENVELYLSRTRALYHWACFTRRSNDSNNLFFQLHGECYHEPLASVRREYFIYLLTDDDPFLLAKRSYWLNRQLDYKWRKPILDKVVDVHSVPTIKLSELTEVYKRVKKLKVNFNLLTAREIISFPSNYETQGS